MEKSRYIIVTGSYSERYIIPRFFDTVIGHPEQQSYTPVNTKLAVFLYSTLRTNFASEVHLVGVLGLQHWNMLHNI